MEDTGSPIHITQPMKKTIIAIAIGGLLAFSIIQNVDHSDRDQRRDEQTEPDKQSDKSDKQSANRVTAEGSTFVFVFEFQTKTTDQELLLRDLRSWSLLNKCDFRTFDQDSKEADVYKVAAEKAGKVSPFLAVVQDKKITGDRKSVV